MGMLKFEMIKSNFFQPPLAEAHYVNRGSMS